jgi:protein TonB
VPQSGLASATLVTGAAPRPKAAFHTARSSPAGDIAQWAAGVEYPQATHRVPPSYSPVAVANDLQGTMWIRAQISETGHVTDAYVLRSIPLLDGAAIAAIRQWSFAPARFDGEPRMVWVQIPVRFTLH